MTIRLQSALCRLAAVVLWRLRAQSCCSNHVSLSVARRHWPEFAQGGKGNITIIDVVRDEAGLVWLDKPLALRTLRDPNATGTWFSILFVLLLWNERE